MTLQKMSDESLKGDVSDEASLCDGKFDDVLFCPLWICFTKGNFT